MNYFKYSNNFINIFLEFIEFLHLSCVFAFGFLLFVLIMDKQTQFPSLLGVKENQHSGDTTCTLEENVVQEAVNVTEVPDPFGNNITIAHSSPSCVLPSTLPSFNMLNARLNENIKKNFPATTKLLDLKRSRIVFDGKACVREFITQVEEYFLYKNFDENVLVGSFSDLLSDIALKWFRTVRISIGSWRQLKEALLKRFDKPEFDYFLEFDLRTRKQKPNESLPDYITEIMDLASRLSTPMLEATTIDIIKHNMLSIYTPFVFGRSIISLEQFLHLGKELEVFANRKSLITNKPPKFYKPSAQFNAVQSNNDLTCLKCKSKGHSYKNCPSIPGMICFKCQKAGVTIKTCDVCNLDKSHSPESKN